MASRKTALKGAAFEQNITKRGMVSTSSKKKETEYPVGPVVLALFVFVVVGSAILQIINSATRGSDM
eukprot:GDKH01028915.1.p3 GENE.GDKH01028915.1~~GDKH01028915.1.p3  ORF type:complete len:67 (-),score=19.56 GDKH01028915.1:101-301(-)